ncbi:MAG: 8-amino-7-oxononanoate synthase [Actinomycetota bacterium]|nr:8-amino-7-oxononanoate synthase [Actinomycetota bacterium]
MTPVTDGAVSEAAVTDGARAGTGEGAASWPTWAEAERAHILARGRWRSVRDFDGAGPTGWLREGDGRRFVVSFASNDYLGLGQHPAVVAAAHAALDRWGAGSGSARLVTGSRPVHSELEAELAEWKGTERAVLFPTGYAANVGVLSALGTTGVRILSDERNHASIVDGCRQARADVTVYPHGDVEAVEHALRQPGRAIVVTDTVFSMDGDLAPVAELAHVCGHHGALLVLDEAHAVLSPEPVLEGCHVLRVGTLSKTLGALGGFVAGPAALAELVVNRARSFIYTTASSPADMAAALAALRVARGAEGRSLRARLRAHVERVTPGHPTPIVSLVLGGEEPAVAASRQLLDQGLLVPAIRPPTVPAETSRLRITLSAAHTTEQVEHLSAALSGLGSGIRARLGAGLEEGPSVQGGDPAQA